ncbi:hypothetical protein HanXRQr2_Chr04g0172381 [Helianthus annuus]|nr:hypothetical protein HanXRQr2_Chr04g0172381 [Helianthus annuus]KAJ0931792.1 hypothetical protein HanPSC8_Chr04g0166031 [Helianthus annuus]
MKDSNLDLFDCNNQHPHHNQHKYTFATSDWRVCLAINVIHHHLRPPPPFQSLDLLQTYTTSKDGEKEEKKGCSNFEVEAKFFSLLEDRLQAVSNNRP